MAELNIASILGVSPSSQSPILALKALRDQLKNSALSAADRATQLQLRADKTDVQKKRSASSNLQNEIEKLREFAAGLDATRLIAKAPKILTTTAIEPSVSSSDSAAASVTLTGTPIASASVALGVSQLATASALTGTSIAESVTTETLGADLEVDRIKSEGGATNNIIKFDNKLPSSLETGDKIRLTAGSLGGQTSGDFFVRVKSAKEVELFSTQAQALNTSSDEGRITFSSDTVGSGTTLAEVTTTTTNVDLSLNTVLNATNLPGLSLQNGAGRIRINNTDVDFTGTQTLGDILDAINESGAGVTATFDSATRQFSLVNNATGASAISISDVTGNLASSLGLTNGTQSVGQNAVFTVEGEEFTRASNTIDGANFGLSGVSIQLNQLTSANNPVTISVIAASAASIRFTADPNEVTEAIQGFFTQLNAVQSSLKNNTAPGGALSGEDSLQGLGKALSQAVSGIFRSDLAAGVRRTGSGIEIDVAALSQGVSGSLDEVLDLFRSPGGAGFAARTLEALRPFTGSSSPLNKEIRDLAKQEAAIAGKLDELTKKEEENRKGIEESLSQIFKALVANQEQRRFLNGVGKSTSATQPLSQFSNRIVAPPSVNQQLSQFGGLFPAT